MYAGLHTKLAQISQQGPHNMHASRNSMPADTAAQHSASSHPRRKRTDGTRTRRSAAFVSNAGLAAGDRSSHSHNNYKQHASRHHCSAQHQQPQPQPQQPQHSPSG